MKIGIYKLSREVKNPNADRRHSRDWRKEPSWREGRRFYIRQDEYGPSLTDGGYYAVSLKRAPKELLDALVPDEPRNIEDYFKQFYEGEGAIVSAVEQLVEEGALTYESVRAAMKRRREQRRKR